MAFAEGTLDAIEGVNLEEAGVRFHLSEVKGPVMDKLEKSDFLKHLSGEIFLSHHDAMRKLDPQTTEQVESEVRLTDSRKSFAGVGGTA